MKKLPTWVEVDLDRLSGNLRALRRALGPGVKILLTVKADAYGHGAVQVARAAEGTGGDRVDMFGVATVDEATELKESGITSPILILSPVLARELPAVISAGFAITLSTFDTAAEAASQAEAAGRTLDVHVEIDTGMGRTGVAQESARDEIARIAALESLRLQGVYTHFPVSDCDEAFTRSQIDAFNDIVAALRADGVTIPMVHCANSAAVSSLRESHMDLVRPGLIAYGLHPGNGTGIAVEPIMSWKSRLVRVREVPAGRNISYGLDYTTRRDSVIGVVPVGYGHGYPFKLSNRGEMIVAGRRVPIVGRVTMDMTMVDLTDLPARPLPGDEVVLVGASGDVSISFHDVADWAGSICYEIMCGISKRVVRTYFRRGKVETYKSLLGVLPNHVVTV